MFSLTVRTAIAFLLLNLFAVFSVALKTELRREKRPHSDIDRDGALAKQLRVASLPTTALIGESGKIQQVRKCVQPFWNFHAVWNV